METKYVFSSVNDLTKHWNIFPIYLNISHVKTMINSQNNINMIFDCKILTWL